MRPANLAAFIGDATSLSLRGFRLGPAGAQQLARTRALQPVTSLDLEGNAIGDEGLRALLRSPVARNLSELTLTDNGLSGAAIGELAGSKLAGKLTKLDLSHNGLGSDDVAALLPALPGVVDLDLSENPLGDAGVAALGPALGELASLRLAWCELGPRGLEALLAGPLPIDATLFLGHNPLGNAGAEQLASAGWRGRWLGLEYTGVDARGLALLVEAGLVAPGRWLNLCGNPIADVTCLHGRSVDMIQLCATPLRPATIAKLRANMKGRVVASAPIDDDLFLACPYCRSEVDERAPRCPACRRDWTRDALSEERRGRANLSQPCPHCDAANEAFASACRACGRWLPRGDVELVR